MRAVLLSVTILPGSHVIAGDLTVTTASVRIHPHRIGSSDTGRRIWAIIGGSSGNLVEWYDFYVYSFTALYFASEFFPKGDQTTQLLNAAGIFAAGFLMRPIGSWFFGRIADKRGRRVSMMNARRPQGPAHDRGGGEAV